MKLITFADGSISMRAAGRRLANQGLNSGLFENGSEHWNFKRLNVEAPGFLEQHGNFIKEHPKGLGLWVWKPAMVLAALESLPEGETLCVLDAGCQLNLNESSVRRWGEYLKMINRSDGLFMQLINGSFEIQNLSDLTWSKRELVELIDPDRKLSSTPQIQSGIILLVNNSRSRTLIQDWYELCTRNNYQLLTNPKDFDSQLPEFKSHRWEQSLLSLIVKNSNFAYIPDETYWAPDWNNGYVFPIWAMRNRTGGDAFRRNYVDLLNLAFGRVERWLRSLIIRFKVFLT
jgi:hypothetical protein